jgi:predicted kinase
MLIALSGMPATGKTTSAWMLVWRLEAVLVRIDTIAEALLGAGEQEALAMGTGYQIGYDVSSDNLRLGRVVIADSVNVTSATRNAWRDVAMRANVRFVEVVVECSDEAEHHRRIENRLSTIHPLCWENVVARALRANQSPKLADRYCRAGGQAKRRYVAIAFGSTAILIVSARTYLSSLAVRRRTAAPSPRRRRGQ